MGFFGTGTVPFFYWPIVSIIMGSTSDLPVMEKAAQLLMPFPLREEEPRITVTIQRDDSGIVVINRIYIIILDRKSVV